MKDERSKVKQIYVAIGSKSSNVTTPKAESFEAGELVGLLHESQEELSVWKESFGEMQIAIGEGVRRLNDELLIAQRRLRVTLRGMTGIKTELKWVKTQNLLQEEKMNWLESIVSNYSEVLLDHSML